MGILNITPDSFSDGGRFLSPQKAVAQGLRMEKEGADLLDIGGESTRPGAIQISAEEEIRRVVPVIARLVSKLQIPLSVDTSKASVAEAALKAGASIVNDVTALRDPEMAAVVKRFRVPVILMHMRGTPQTMQQQAVYRKVVCDVLDELRRSVRKAIEAGIPRSKILIDPGIGFAKNPEQSLRLLRELDRFKKTGFPVVVGPSRKSFLKKIVADRFFGTASAVAYAAAHGADIVRVHDVAAMRQVVDVVEAIHES